MGKSERECGCDQCRSGQDHPEREAHRLINRMRSELDERQRRLYAATEAKRRGWGGISAVHKITGLNMDSIRRGIREVDGLEAALPAGRVRISGGGRKSMEASQPGIEAALSALLEDETAGDPEGKRNSWTKSSLRSLADRLGEAAYEISHETVSKMLKDKKYGLRTNAKVKSGSSHPERDQQFEQIKEQVSVFREAGDPVISVDTKKRN